MGGWPTSAELVNLAVDRYADGSPTVLADMLNLGANGYQKVYRWQRGGRLDYDDALKILDLFGWLNLQGEEAEQEASIARDEDRFRATVLRLLGRLGTSVEDLAAAVDEIASQRERDARATSGRRPRPA